MRNYVIDTFLKKNNVDNIADFIQKSDFKIDVWQTNISNNELHLAGFGEKKQKKVPLSMILGFSDSYCKISKSFFENFSNFFDSSQTDGYHTRAISMLDYPVDEIVDKLSESFIDEPIKTISIDGKYYISSNGLHRFMALKIYYMLEIYKGKTREELDQKYMITVNDTELNSFKIFAKYLGSKFNPRIEYDDNDDISQWLDKVKEKIKTLNESEYNFLIRILSFTHFEQDNSGIIMIKYLFENFPNIVLDVYKNLIITNNYECSVNIFNCMERYFPNYRNQLLQIINENMDCSLNKAKNNNDFEYFNMDQKWMDYGVVRKISNKIGDSRRFSEGSESLEKCLKIIWNQGIETRACCKGNHLSINVDNKPEVNCEAYIAFESDKEWKDYLSPEIITCEDVIIYDNTIYYYGDNKEMFFRMLSRDFLTGKKQNKSLLSEKNNIITDELEYKSFVNAIQQIGFDEEQIHFLTMDYLNIQKCMKEFYSAANDDREAYGARVIEANERYIGDLIFYIDRNNQRIKNSSYMNR